MWQIVWNSNQTKHPGLEIGSNFRNQIIYINNISNFQTETSINFLWTVVVKLWIISQYDVLIEN